MAKNIFTVLPMSQRFSLSAGGTYEGSIIVANPVDGETDFAYEVVATPYSVIGSNYTADLESVTIHSKIADWITIENPTGVIPPNGSATIRFTITVPEDTPAGGQYATLLVSQQKEQSASEGVSVSSVLQLASVIYADVSGITLRDGEVLENEVPSFALTQPIHLNALIENRGNTHQDAIFRITITNKITGETILPNANSSGEYSEIVLPETSRYISREINNLPLLGVVNVKQEVFFNDKASVVEKDLIICPIWFIFLVLFTITSIVMVIVTKIRRRRKERKLI